MKKEVYIYIERERERKREGEKERAREREKENKQVKYHRCLVPRICKFKYTFMDKIKVYYSLFIILHRNIFSVIRHPEILKVFYIFLLACISNAGFSFLYQFLLFQS
jgi:hypothetical protein